MKICTIYIIVAIALLMVAPPLGIIGLLILAIYLIGKLLKYAKRYLDDIHMIAKNSKKEP